MRLSDLDYPLPKELIAQNPLSRRDASRLLVVHRGSQKMEDRLFSDLPEYLPSGDVLVLNDTKVYKARVLGKKKGTGGKVDILFLEREPVEGRYRCLIQPVLKEGQVVEFPENIEAAYVGRDKEGTALLTMEVRLQDWLDKHGTMPLPPYIKREPDAQDVNVYQTVYAQKEGAVAAPTAGLHFTHDLLQRLKKGGVAVEYLTLHVGYGTFKPVEDLENHRMHAESFELSEAAARRLNDAKKNAKKVWAVGTTALRVLETCVRKGLLAPGKGETDLFIKSPFEFECVDHLITNFHLPKTTLLLLVSAFMGEELRKKSYEHAIREKYRFYSYGDAMLIL